MVVSMSLWLASSAETNWPPSFVICSVWAGISAPVPMSTGASLTAVTVRFMVVVEADQERPSFTEKV